MYHQLRVALEKIPLSEVNKLKKATVKRRYSEGVDSIAISKRMRLDGLASSIKCQTNNQITTNNKGRITDFLAEMKQEKRQRKEKLDHFLNLGRNNSLDADTIVSTAEAVSNVSSASSSGKLWSSSSAPVSGSSTPVTSEDPNLILSQQLSETSAKNKVVVKTATTSNSKNISSTAKSSPLKSVSSTGGSASNCESGVETGSNDTASVASTGSRHSSTSSGIARDEDIFEVPRTIRFPPAPPTKCYSEVVICKWELCGMEFDSTGKLLDHLKTVHAVGEVAAAAVSANKSNETDDDEEEEEEENKYKCLWEGCKVYGKGSCSKSWLEKHVTSHGGNKPFQCIVDGCKQRFGTQVKISFLTFLKYHQYDAFSRTFKNRLECNEGWLGLVRK